MENLQAAHFMSCLLLHISKVLKTKANKKKLQPPQQATEVKSISKDVFTSRGQAFPDALEKHIWHSDSQLQVKCLILKNFHIYLKWTCTSHFKKVNLTLFIPVILKAVRILLSSWSETFKLAVYVLTIYLHYLFSSGITLELQPNYLFKTPTNSMQLYFS